MYAAKHDDMVIIVFGLPGSGKSYFSERLADRLNALYLNSDQLRMQLLAERDYSDREKLMVYDTMRSAMEEALEQHKTVVMDGTFYKQNIRAMFEAAAGNYGQQLLYIEITAAEDIIKERVSKPRQYSEAGYAVYLKLKKEAEPLDKEHLVLESTNNNITAMLSKAEAYIKNQS